MGEHAIRYVSLFSGIEAASVAWAPLGWQPIAFSELEPFPKAVLAAHYPQVPDLGDITKINWEDYDDCLSADIIVGGSPCQSFSIAGDRSGLSGASGLMWEYVRAVQAIRPHWVVWENVPGALSSSGGEDYQCLLQALDELGYTLAWRVLDAQFFGVAQRRRRVYLVGSLGTDSAAEVLFEPESLRWNHQSGKEKRQALAEKTAGSVGSANAGSDCLTPWDTQSRRIYRADSIWPTLDAREQNGTDGKAVALDYHPQGSRLKYADQNVVQTLSARMGTGGNNVPLVQDMRPATLQIRAGKAGGGKGALIQEDMSATLTVAQTQTLFPGDGTVRRLTPVECERLQGFPDGWTDVPYRGKDHPPDSPRYKALGNSMAVPVMRWIGQRIQRVEKI